MFATPPQHQCRDISFGSVYSHFQGKTLAFMVLYSRKYTFIAVNSA